MGAPGDAPGSAAGITAMLEERGERYGKFCDQANLSVRIKEVLHDAILRRPDNTFTADQMEALHMIAHKIARILNGDPNYIDSWDDIAGYATLVADRLRGVVR